MFLIKSSYSGNQLPFELKFKVDENIGIELLEFSIVSHEGGALLIDQSKIFL